MSEEQTVSGCRIVFTKDGEADTIWSVGLGKKVTASGRDAYTAGPEEDQSRRDALRSRVNKRPSA
jgi:hypothetical protein